MLYIKENINFKSRKFRLIASFILIGIILIFSIALVRKRNAVKNYIEGTQLLREGYYKDAIDKLEKSLNFWPKGWWFEDAQNKLFYCKLNSGEDIDKFLPKSATLTEEAEVGGDIILKVLLPVIIIIGAVFITLKVQKKKKTEKFIQYIQNVAKRIKANLPPTSLEESKDNLSSVKDYQEYIDYYKEGEFVKLAECLIAEYFLKNYPDTIDYVDKAVNSYKNFIDTYPNSDVLEEMLYKIANLYFLRLKDYTESARFYQKIMDKYPDSKWVKIAEGRVNLIRNNSDYDREPLSIYISAERYYENKEYDKALSEFRMVVSKFPKSNLADDALYAIGDIYIYKINKPEEAIKEYQQIIDKYPDSRYAPNAQYKIGESYRKEKKFETAISAYKKFIDNYPQCDFLDYAYYYIGQCYEQMKKLSEAKDFYQKLIDEYPSSMWVVVATSRLEVLKDIKE